MLGLLEAPASWKSAFATVDAMENSLSAKTRDALAIKAGHFFSQPLLLALHEVSTP